MSLELLPNELLLQLFKFLETSELLNVFCCCNDRFNRLLLEHFSKFGLNFRSTHKRYFDFMCQQALLSIVSEIPALGLSDDDEAPYQSRAFMAHGLTLNEFISLKSLSIYEIRSGNTLNVFLNGLSALSNLTKLKLIRCSIKNIQPTCRFILNEIWRLPKLALLHFDVTFRHDRYLANITTSSSSIKHLTIKGVSCPPFELSKLFQYTPNLEYISLDSKDDDQRLIMPVISSLITLELHIDTHAAMITNLLQKTENLRNLKVTLSGTHLNGNQWEQIINTYLPQLETLQFRMHYSCHIENHEQTTDELLESFRSRFWLEERKWYVRCHSNPVITLCYINIYTLPYAFSHFDYYDNDLCQSTCPDTADNWCYEQVMNLSYSKIRWPYIANHPQIRFPNIRHLYIPEIVDDTFSVSVPNLNKLQLVEIPRSASLSTVQALLDQKTELHSLILHDCMFTLNNVSIRRLDLLSDFHYLNSDQCNELSHSSLIIRCEVLLIKIKNEMCLLPLLENMHHLRALTIQCRNDNWTRDGLVIDDTIIETLRGYLPPTAEIGRDLEGEYYIRAWIP